MKPLKPRVFRNIHHPNNKLALIGKSKSIDVYGHITPTRENNSHWEPEPDPERFWLNMRAHALKWLLTRGFLHRLWTIILSCYYIQE